KKKQMQPTPLILRYGKGGFNTLHQDLYGDVYFPIQAVMLLSEQGRDFTGGEFVLTQQNPRAQSQAIVLNPGKGDLILFTTNFRPARGRHGYHRVHVKHDVSEVHWGERFTLGIIFHDALTWQRYSRIGCWTTKRCDDFCHQRKFPLPEMRACGYSEHCNARQGSECIARVVFSLQTLSQQLQMAFARADTACGGNTNDGRMKLFEDTFDTSRNL